MNQNVVASLSCVFLVACSASPSPSTECPTPDVSRPDAPLEVDAHSPSGAEPRKHHAQQSEGDYKKPLVHSFDEQAAEKWAAKFEGPARDAWQKPDQVVAMLKLEQGMSIADIGAGTGYFLPYLSTAVGAEGRVFAMDVAANMVRYMKARAIREGWENVQPGLALTDDPLLPNRSLDRVLIVDTWHHIAGRHEYAEKLLEALKTDGSVWIVDFKQDSPEGPPQQHRLTPQQVAQELVEAGLSTVQIDDTLLPHQYIVMGKR